MDISVLIPIYNSADFLKNSLLSLHQQTEDNIEFILINDGSTDNSKNVINEFISLTNDRRFRLINKTNSGYGDSLNKALKNSLGEYIGIYEPDDIIDKDFYRELNLKKENFDVVKYNGIYVKNNNECYRLFRYKQKEICTKSLLLNRMKLSHPSIVNGIYKKKFILNNQIKFCTGAGSSFQDEQFRVSILACRPSIKIIDKCKYYYVQHQNQSINNCNGKVKAIINNWEEEKEWLQQFYYDTSYFCFSTFRQMQNLKKKITPKNFKLLEKGFRELNFSKSDLIRCVYLMIKLRVRLEDIHLFCCLILRNMTTI